MKILNIQEFKAEQSSAFTERRTSQYTRFLDKSVDFVTYYSINKALSTESYRNRQVDSYIGMDSPVKYNKINNLPIYGFEEISQANSFNDEEGGPSAADFEGSIVMLHNIIEPVEGDCFILNIFSSLQFFRVTEVEQVIMRSKPCYNVRYTIGVPDLLNQLNKQVVEEYNAIFDNIGTQDRVVISNNEYTMMKEYEKIYSEIVDYYITSYYNNTITMFEMTAATPIDESIRYTDKFLVMFMKRNRIITLDTVLKNSFVLDNNFIETSQDLLEYKKTIYWAIENRDISKFIPTTIVELKKISSPFTLLIGQTRDEYYISSHYLTTEPDINKFYFDYDFGRLLEKWKVKDIYGQNTYEKVLGLIVSYLKGSIMMPGYFKDIIGDMTALQEFIYIPIILYIIRTNIIGLMNSKITI